MSQCQVKFNYGSKTLEIQCKEDTKMVDICKNFIFKSGMSENDIKCYSYNSNTYTSFNQDITFNQLANPFDKERKQMSIVVIDKKPIFQDKTIIKSKNVICPECKENILMEIKNHKINLFGCKNKHKFENMLFKDFAKTQMIDLRNIKCGKCKERNKAEAYQNQFSKCYECDINLCAICKLNHDPSHNIFDYDKVNYICLNHKEPLQIIVIHAKLMYAISAKKIITIMILYYLESL